MLYLPDSQLIKLLVEADSGDDAALLSWMETTPKYTVTNRLQKVVITGVTSKRQNSICFFFGMLLLLAVIVFGATLPHLLLPHGHSHAKIGAGLKVLWAGIVPGAFLAASLLEAIRLWQARFYGWGRSAVFRLLERDGRRAVPLLVTVCRVAARSSDLLWREKTTAALIHALDAEPSPSTDTVTRLQLYRFVKDLLLLWRFNRKADLNETETAILVSALRYLHRAGGVDSMTLLAQVAALPHVSAQPNRALVGELAASLTSSGALLHGAVRVPLIQDVENAAVASAVVPDASVISQVQTLHRS